MNSKCQENHEKREPLGQVERADRAVDEKTVVEQVERGKISTNNDLSPVEFKSDFEHEWWRDKVIESSSDKNGKCD